VTVRGGKNSKEKNGSSFFIFRKIFCTSDSGDLAGDVDLEEVEEVRDEVIEDEEDVLEHRRLSAEAGKEGCDWTFGITPCCAITGGGDWDLE